MSNVQIPNLPSASALAGAELFEAVQAGVSSKVTADQIATFVLSGVATSTVASFSGGTTGLTPATATTGAVVLSGTLAITNGGTGQITASAAFDALSPITTLGDLILGSGSNTAARLAIGASGHVLTSNGTTATWAAPVGTVSSVAVSGGTTGLTTSGGPITTSGTITLAGTLALANGGTGQTTASAAFNALSPITSVGDVIIGNGVNSATRLAIGSSGTVLTSNGTTATWTTPPGTGTVTSVDVSGASTGLTFSGGPITTSGTITLGGTLAIGSGGTGQTTAAAAFNALSPITTTGDLIIGNGSNSATRLGIGTNGQILVSNGTTASWQTVSGTGTVTSVDGSGGTTGLTLTGGPITAAGTLTLGGTLAIANGGTGATSAAAALTALGGIGPATTDTLTNKTLTSPTINSGALSGTFSGTPTFSGLQTVSASAATSAAYYQVWQPTDYAVGKPRLEIVKTATATQWNIGLWDGSTYGGTINFAALTGLQWNGSQLIDAASAQTITGIKTVSTGSATSFTAYGIFQPTDYGVGKPRLGISKQTTAGLWEISTYDSVNNAGTINFACTTGLTWNGVQLATISTAQTLTNKTLTDSSTYFADNLDASKTFQFQLSSISTATTRTWTVPDVNDTFVGLAATQTLTNKTLTSPAITTPTITGTKETRVAMGANDIDLSAGNYFTKTISTTTTLTVSNVPSTGTGVSFILDLTNGGSAAITWWSGMKWPGGTAPTLTASGRDVLGFFTHDGGTTWTGLLLGKDVK